MTLLWQFANTGPQLIVYSGTMEAMRQSWTDDRMDDLVLRIDNGFAQAREDSREMRREMAAQSAELRRENQELAREVREDVKVMASELRFEMAALHRETSEGFDGVNKRFDLVHQRFDVLLDAFNRRFDTLVVALIATMLSGLIGLIVSTF